jgi:hypothetical protein
MVISMIFDLATFTIAVMAFTSTAIAQIEEPEVQLNVYLNSTNCSLDSYSFSMYTNNSLPIFAKSENDNCSTSACATTDPKNQPLIADGDTTMAIWIFNTTNANPDQSTVTRCWIYSLPPGSIDDCDSNMARPLGDFYTYVRPEPGCQVIPHDTNPEFKGEILILCSRDTSTSKCY